MSVNHETCVYSPFLPDYYQRKRVKSNENGLILTLSEFACLDRTTERRAHFRWQDLPVNLVSLLAYRERETARGILGGILEGRGA